MDSFLASGIDASLMRGVSSHTMDLRFFRAAPHWEAAIAIAVASAVCGGFITSVAPLSPAVAPGAPTCAHTAVLIQFFMGTYELALPIGVLLAVAFLAAEWLAYRSACDETHLLRRALHISLFGFALLLVTVLGASLGLFVLPAASCVV